MNERARSMTNFIPDDVHGWIDAEGEGCRIEHRPTRPTVRISVDYGRITVDVESRGIVGYGISVRGVSVMLIVQSIDNCLSR